jgi:hypothetical protein
MRERQFLVLGPPLRLCARSLVSIGKAPRPRAPRARCA